LVNHLLRAGDIDLGELDDLRKAVSVAESKQAKPAADPSAAQGSPEQGSPEQNGGNS
jgi:hypothetical protein